MKNDALKMYSKYHLERDDERLGLFLRLYKSFISLFIKYIIRPAVKLHITFWAQPKPDWRWKARSRTKQSEDEKHRMLNQAGLGERAQTTEPVAPRYTKADLT